MPKQRTFQVWRELTRRINMSASHDRLYQIPLNHDLLHGLGSLIRVIGK